jgi:hypothetical protein
MMRFALLLFAAAALHAQDVAEIVKRSLEHEQWNPKPPRDYVWTEDAEERSFDASGKVIKITTQTREVMAMYDEQFTKLIRKNGKPLTDAQTRSEQAKFDNALRKREHESPEAKAKREKAEQKADAEDLFCRTEFGKLFTFKLMGTETIRERPAWIVGADASPDAPAKCGDNQIARKFHVRLWIDQTDYRWTKVVADSIAPLAFGKVLVRMPAGAIHVTTEEVRMADGLWAPSRDWQRYDAKLMGLKTLHQEDTTVYRDYRKFQTESRIVTAGDGK